MSGAPPPTGRVSAELLPLGQRLRAAREERGLSLDEIETSTHIRKVYLDAMEAGRAAEFPADVFLKGFLRTYANHLGLDGTAMVEEFKATRAAAVQPEAPPEPGSRQRPRPLRPRGRRPGRRRRRRQLAAVAWIVVAIALAWFGHALLRHRGRAGATATYVPPAASTASPPTTPAPHAVVPPTVKPAPVQTSKPTVQVHAGFTPTSSGWQGTYVLSGAHVITVDIALGDAACWVRRWVDGTLVQPDVTLQPGTSVEWTATDTLRLELGDAPAIRSIEVDGQATGSLPPQDVNPEWLTFKLG